MKYCYPISIDDLQIITVKIKKGFSKTNITDEIGRWVGQSLNPFKKGKKLEECFLNTGAT